MTFQPKAAFVLAAGLGLRMRPLTESLPKPLVRLNGRPLIDHVLDRLEGAGIGRVVINVHHLADQLVRHLEGRRRPHLVLSDERAKLLDTGGGVKKALKTLGAEPFLIHNADSVWIEGVGSNLARLARAWDEERMDGLLLLAAVTESVGYDGRGDFILGPDGAIRRRGEREFAPFAFTGVSIAHPRLFADSPKGPFSLNLLWDRAIEHGRLYGVRLEGVWMHVGSPEALEAAERLMEREQRS
jgi:MurNAc alpha-1-phosphate uridylyltransferase